MPRLPAAAAACTAVAAAAAAAERAMQCFAKHKCDKNALFCLRLLLQPPHHQNHVCLISLQFSAVCLSDFQFIISSCARVFLGEVPRNRAGIICFKLFSRPLSRRIGAGTSCTLCSSTMARPQQQRYARLWRDVLRSRHV